MDTTSLWTTWSYFRFALLVSNVTLETYFSEEDDTSQQKMNPHETAAVICKIDYSIAKATILRGSKDGSTQVYNLTAARHTNGLTGIMLGEIMHNALRAARDLDMRDYVPDQEELKYFPQVTAPLYYVLLRTLARQQSMSRFLSADTLQSSARQVWSGVASQFVRGGLYPHSECCFDRERNIFWIPTSRGTGTTSGDGRWIRSTDHTYELHHGHDV
jgi:hypothetical protein